jgi:SAM-dependent methyltransferase
MVNRLITQRVNHAFTMSAETAPMRPFVDFYRANRISPVAQDIADRRRHFERRDSLYRHLGLVPSFLSGKRVLEFGPGSGHNALHTLALGPSRYVLVDANPTGLERSRALLESEPNAGVLEFVASMIEDYDGDSAFDLVLCEGVIPFQIDPPAFLRQVARAVAPGGVVIATTADPVSCLPEILRKLMARLIVRGDAPAEQQLAALRPIFRPHLASLAGMSRSHDDWILDQLIQPWVGEMFSIQDAVGALDSRFDLHGTSPRFLADWRWYKAMHGAERRWNETAVRSYLANLHSLLDCRATFPPREPQANATLLQLCGEVYAATSSIDRGTAVREAAERALGALDGIYAQISSFSLEIAGAVNDAASALDTLLQHGPVDVLPCGRLAPWFGRGQQYVSFIRR